MIPNLTEQLYFVKGFGKKNATETRLPGKAPDDLCIAVDTLQDSESLV